jgi:hypothetical protein
MAFEERLDVHYELRCTHFSYENFENKGFPTKKRSLEIYFAKCSLKNDFTVFQKKNSIQYSDVKKYFYMK